MGAGRWRLVADLGATHLRFGLLQPGALALSAVARYAADDFPTPEAALRRYLAWAGPSGPPGGSCLAVAAPVEGDRARWTNRDWTLSVASLEDVLDCRRVMLVNDYAAVARLLPALGSARRIQVGGGTAVSGAVMAVLGPGTGLGMAALAREGGHPVPLASEGGHALLAPTGRVETELLAYLESQQAPVSWERVVSGPGLVRIYRYLASRGSVAAQALTPVQITADALASRCALCRQALDLFYQLLGSASADLAMMTGARGGVYLAGAMLNSLSGDLLRSGFRARFEQREGRYREYMQAIPTYLLAVAEPGLLGAACWLEQDFDPNAALTVTVQ